MKQLKKIPKFKSEKEEARFWATHDSTEYVDYSKARRSLFPNLKPSTRTISIRLPESLIEHLKLLANKRDVPYQSLIKIFLAEMVVKETVSVYGTVDAGRESKKPRTEWERNVG